MFKNFKTMIKTFYFLEKNLKKKRFVEDNDDFEICACFDVWYLCDECRL